MRHMKSGRKLGRNSSHRKAMYRNMVTSLFLHGRIQTTEAKAKELRSVADKLITLGKRVPPSVLLTLTGDELADAKARRVHAIRLAARQVQDKQALEMLFNEYSERYQTRPGGYTRTYKVGFRSGDNAPMALVELVEAYEPSEAAADEPEPVVEEAAPAADEDTEDADTAG
ncbi:MAG: 50S ribosomal protein L17 [Proteobacteria bacterium]|nr:50S ribosomal protein L17 [Pseudomonadota bacterium]MCP4918218.1 50S ribosomal protein L17 [Pseudomonadota bacterium]